MASKIFPKSFIFNEREVYLAEELRDYDPTFFIGCTKTVRNIIKRKNIPETDYCYGIKLKNIWNVRDSTYKTAKLMLSKEWVEKFILNSNESKDEIPEILELNDNEKFRDANGKIINIEVRGERNRKNCYFKVSDISKGFEMPSLKKNIIDINRNIFGYQENKHYKYFNIPNESKTIKKTLYLTFEGFLYMINNNRNNFISKNVLILNKWLNDFINNQLIGEYILISLNKHEGTCGMIYLVTSPLVNAVKIGYWRGSIDGLKTRYGLSYGNNLEIHYKETNNVRKSEKQIHNYFREFNICNELFEKNNLQSYINYLDNSLKI